MLGKLKKKVAKMCIRDRYYTMSLGLDGEMMTAVGKGLETVGIAGSLAVGILLVSTVFRLINRRRG